MGGGGDEAVDHEMGLLKCLKKKSNFVHRVTCGVHVDRGTKLQHRLVMNPPLILNVIVHSGVNQRSHLY